MSVLTSLVSTPTTPAFSTVFQGIPLISSATILISEPYILASDPEFSSLILLASISIALILSAVTVVSAPTCNGPPIANAVNTAATNSFFLSLVLVANLDATTYHCLDVDQITLNIVFIIISFIPLSII